MKLPLSVIIVTKDPKTMREIHNRFDAQTNFPKLKLLMLSLKIFFGKSLTT